MRSIIHKDEQAVSPVIATILMVAITVVLAAVLYVMVSGLISGPGGTPTAWGVNIGKSGDQSNWTLTFTSIPSSAATNSVFITIRNAAGASVSGATNVAFSTITAAGYNAMYFAPDPAIRRLRCCAGAANPLPPRRHWRFSCLPPGEGILPTRARSPRPLKLFNRQRERGRRVRHAAELDHEVGGGSGIDGFEDHDGVGLAEQSEELVDHDVVRDLRVLEQAGPNLPTAREERGPPRDKNRRNGGGT